MTAQILDGKALASRLRGEIAAKVARLKEEAGFIPGLAVVLVGEDPASQVYVRNKRRACEEVGFRSYGHTLPADTTQGALLDLIADLNENPQVHGILVQLPLPAGIDPERIINAINPMKDVDGFHPINVGRQNAGLACLAPCTPRGCMLLLREVLPDLAGLDALVIGRSNIVGKPLASMLLQANATVTIAHSKTRDLPALCARADILVAALGRPGFVRGDWIKPGAVVIDVGINRLPNPDDPTKTKLVGDVVFAEASARARAITPVPGGVGPMTIACLLENTLMAADRLREVGHGL